uniref:Uncharacterized protein n=1 Tax=Octopus bimaculoides TaxID=37653 RepID=A0A0L8H296_OCTBM
MGRVGMGTCGIDSFSHEIMIIFIRHTNMHSVCLFVYLPLFDKTPSPHHCLSSSPPLLFDRSLILIINCPSTPAPSVP